MTTASSAACQRVDPRRQPPTLPSSYTTTGDTTLVFNEEVAPGDIAVLVNGPTARASILERSIGTSIPLTDADILAVEDVVVDTVRRFKGLERPAVVLVVAEDEMEHREFAYVAFSRARAYLCVVSSADEARWLTGGIDEYVQP